MSLIELLRSNKTSPFEIIDCLDNDRQIYGLINWYFTFYKTNTFISKLIKECIVNEKIKNLKRYRHIIESLFSTDAENNEILYIHSLIDSGLNKKALEYIDSVEDYTKNQFLKCFFHLQSQNYGDLLTLFKNNINSESFVSTYLPAIISELSQTRYLDCITLVRKLVSNKDSFSSETKDLIDNISYSLLQNKYASLIIACMNREDNLATILPSWINIPYIKEIIIVDYSSKKPISQHEKIKPILDSCDKINIIRVEGEKFFNLGKAYNLAFDHCNYDTVIKIDSDYECINDQWLDILFSYKDLKDIFIHADYRFSFELSGFFVVNQSNFLYFREDLNGYGYDEIDLYNRIKHENHNIKEIVWFDIENSIKHLYHNDKKRSQHYKNTSIKTTEQKNRELCQVHSPKYPIRNKYANKNGVISFLSNKIDSIFCINLEERQDRWTKLCKIPNITRFNAHKVTKDSLQEYNLTLKPVDLSSSIYFQINAGAIGCYVSHYLLWNHIIDNDIPYSLILEDDVDAESVKHLLSSNIILDDLEFIQLSKRIRYHNRFLFDGGESYILSLSGAKKLVEFTHNPFLLNQIIPEQFPSVKNLHYQKKIHDFYNWNSHRAITCAVDKFMGYCCENALPETIRLNNFVYAAISLDETTSRLSNINHKFKNAWELSEKEVMKYVTECGSVS